MLNIKFCKSIRKLRTTSRGGLVVFKRLTDQLELLTPLDAKEFIKLHGHSLKAIFFALLIKSLMGTKSLNDFEDKLIEDKFLRKLANFTRKVGKTVIGRNMKRFKPSFLHQSYNSLTNKLIDLGIVTLKRIAIDSTFIEVHGGEYQKATKGKGKKKVVLGYRLSVAFDLDSKLPIAYIITFGHKHDSQFLIPLIEIIRSKYGMIPERVVMDRGYYGQKYFNYLTENGIEWEIPVKKYSNIKKRFQELSPEFFQVDEGCKFQYADDYITITGYGLTRVIWLVCEEIEEWMPEDLKPRDWWGILTNRADLDPAGIIQAYKDRWELEVFFRSTRQRMALGRLPGRDFRQVQAHVFFVFTGYILLMLVRHLVPLESDTLTIDLANIQKKVLFVKAVFIEKKKSMNVHFTAREWLYHHEEMITLF